LSSGKLGRISTELESVLDPIDPVHSPDPANGTCNLVVRHDTVQEDVAVLATDMHEPGIADERAESGTDSVLKDMVCHIKDMVWHIPRLELAHERGP
jgi:hypothetical protein